VCPADVHVARSARRAGGLATGVELADEYLEFMAGRCRPNTVLAAGYDLTVFFRVVGKPPPEVRPADVLAFIAAQRSGTTGGRCVLQSVGRAGETGGVSAARRITQQTYGKAGHSRLNDKLRPSASCCCGSPAGWQASCPSRSTQHRFLARVLGRDHRRPGELAAEYHPWATSATTGSPASHPL